MTSGPWSVATCSRPRGEGQHLSVLPTELQAARHIGLCMVPSSHRHLLFRLLFSPLGCPLHAMSHSALTQPGRTLCKPVPGSQGTRVPSDTHQPGQIHIPGSFLFSFLMVSASSLTHHLPAGPSCVGGLPSWPCIALFSNIDFQV